MKFTKSDIREIIAEEIDNMLAESHDEENEGAMAVNQLNQIGQMSAELGDMISDATDLEEWAEAKITKAHDYLNTVLNHLASSQELHSQIPEEPDPLKADDGAVEPDAVEPLRLKTPTRQKINRLRRNLATGDWSR